MLPEHRRFVIIGAGIHGLSTAWRLASLLKARGQGDGSDVIVLDKTGVGSGASGIACGTVRNNYYQPAMRELMAHNVDVWESDPEAFHYHSVGFLQISPESMREDISTIYEQQQAIGYASTLVEGAGASDRYMKDLLPDWRAQGITSVLHEHQGGYAHNLPSVLGLAAKAEAAGVRILSPVSVMGFETDADAISAVETDQGRIACDHVVIAAGPWVRDFWGMLELPETISIASPGGGASVERPMWTYWSLQEGTLQVDPGFLTTAAGDMPPVIHVDSDEPLIDDIDGSLVTEKMWGIYYKPDFNFGGIQGGAMPFIVDQAAEDVAVDPYGPASPDFVVGADFARMWTSALAHCQERFAGMRDRFAKEPSGGIGCFTPDSFPVFDTFRSNAYVIADSNHGYKMIGVGDLVAKELLGDTQSLLEPFRFGRYAAGELHPTSHSPFPWS